MTRPFREINDKASHNTASTSFDMTRFLAGSRLKQEETHAATIAYNDSYSKNENHAQRELARHTYDQEQHARNPAGKVILAHDYIKGGAKEITRSNLKEAWNKVRDEHNIDKSHRFYKTYRNLVYQFNQGIDIRPTLEAYKNKRGTSHNDDILRDFAGSF